jgi:hypothetical protein
LARSRPRGKVGRRAGAAGALCLLASACASQSRYRSADCPGDRFPEAREVLALPGFEPLRHFRGPSDYKRGIDFEMWGDQKFDFAMSLRYHYPKDDPQRLDCVRGVSLMVRYPPTREGSVLVGEFVSLFERRLGGDLAPLRAAYSGVGKVREDFSRPFSMPLDGLVGEVTGIHSVVREDFASVGFYERRYYQAMLVQAR